ncbi:MAG: nucleotidyltransferase substrate binding protein [Bacteroidia bacterium]|nr:nucleotidyltransferase substrate binding protein [Bacteroidia bacterium]
MIELKKSTELFEKSLQTLTDILQQRKKSVDKDILRDATIQRFEYNADVFWKLLKVFLFHQHGMACQSPKSCIREAFNNGLVNEQECALLLEMMDDRNLTSHTYHFDLFEKIFIKIIDYEKIMREVLNRIKNSIN